MVRQLILGTDPSIQNIPDIYKRNQTVDIIISWGADLIEACKDKVAGVKFQIAYFENLGLDGLIALAKLIHIAKEQKLKTIMDAKRGDIGSTSAAYAQAYLSDENAAGTNDFSCDYLTVNPLMGEDCLDPFVEMAIQNNKGIFVLLETSNPGAKMILKETLKNESTVNSKIASYISFTHKKLGIVGGAIGPIGCVVGATNEDSSHWREKLPNSLFLMPGIGAQGGCWDIVKSCDSGAGVWVPISRGITQSPHEPSSKKAYINTVKDNVSYYYKQLTSALS